MTFRWPVHPFLMAIAGPMLVWAQNASLLRISVLVRPVALSVCGTALLFLLLWALLRSARRAAMLVSMLELLFWTRGHVVNGVSALLGESAPSGAAVRLITAAFALAIFIPGLVHFARRTPSFELTSTFNAFGLCLVLVPVMTAVASGAVTLRRRAPLPTAPPHAARPGKDDVTLRAFGAADRLSDIYYLVLDAYGRADVIRRLYNFDNEPFLSALESRGFFVARRAHSNYPFTELSLASSLNGAYVEDFLQRRPSTGSDRWPLTKAIDESWILRVLRPNGYEVVTIPSGIARVEISSPDRTLEAPVSLDEFESILYGTTALPDLGLLLGPSAEPLVFRRHRERIRFALGALPAARSGTRPLFVFCHILCPHPPFVMSPSGERRTPAAEGEWFDLDGRLLTIERGVRREDYVSGYRDQLQWLNGEVLLAIDRILASTKGTAIILLQGDHGPRSIGDWNRPETVDLEEALGILSALYVPSGNHVGFRADMTPVNSFAAVLNAEFGTSIPFRADRAFYPPATDFYSGREVTRALRNAAAAGP